MKRIGSLYLSSEHFKSEENKTIGMPLVGEDFATILNNRRNTNSKLEDSGKEIKNNVAKYLKDKYGINVKFVFDRYCGCSRCPCSPGFKIIIDENKEDLNFSYMSYVKGNHYIEFFDNQIPEKVSDYLKSFLKAV